MPRFRGRAETRVRLPLAATVLLFSVLLVACTPSDDVYLPALLEDPMAQLDLEGAELVRRSERGLYDDRVGGVRVAKVQQSFEVLDGFDGDELVLEAVAAAESAGWVFGDDQPTSFGLWQGTKTLEVGRGDLSINIVESTGYLQVNLETRETSSTQGDG
jgi:hypothetical protein